MFGLLLKVLRFLSVIVFFVVMNIFLLFYFLLRFKHPKNNLLQARLLSFVLQKFLRVEVEYRGVELLQSGQVQVLIANHQSFFDTVVFGAIFPGNTIALGKKSLLWLPVFGWVFYLSGNLFVNRKNHEKAMKTMKAVDYSLQKGTSLWMFPEGTRSHGKGLKRFKKGAFYAALQNKVPIQPIVSSTFKGRIDFAKWNAGKVIVEVLPAIETLNVDVEKVQDVLDSVYHIMNSKIHALDNELQASQKTKKNLAKARF